MNRSCNNIINCLSVDVEGFVESNLQSFNIDKKYINKSAENIEIEKNVHFLLELLGDLGIHATFFCLGRIAEDIPGIIREIVRGGHEIACHGYEHIRITPNINKGEFKNKLIFAKHRLEDISGKKVYGFRAPDFSITTSSAWALEILKEVGFFYDSSIYPIGFHDVYGIKKIDHFINKLDNGLVEFPLSTTGLLGERFPFGGGGYFRIYPLFFTKYCISKTNKLGHSCMFYIHPYEVGPIIPKIRKISPWRRFRHYYNTRNGDKRLKKILKEYNFAPAVEVLKEKGLIPQKIRYDRH